MNAIMLSERRDGRTRAVNPVAEEGYSLNVAVVYQNSSARAWADDVLDLMAAQAGENALECTEWLINNITDSATFSRGIQVLAEADAMVIALNDLDRLPREFYRWVNCWLEVRSGKPGALIALVGKGEESETGGMKARRYLEAVARQSGLELFLKECTAADPSTNFEPDDLRPLLKAA